MVASIVCQPSTSSKDFSSETTGTIPIKFHMQPPDNGGKKLFIFGPGHMTKMATLQCSVLTQISASGFLFLHEAVIMVFNCMFTASDNLYRPY